MAIFGNENPDPKDKPINNQQMKHLSHVAIVGGMALSLGTAIVAGLKKSGALHVVSAFCFAGLALTHLFMHRRQLSFRIEKGLHPNRKHVSPPADITER
jgi:hypothetical protein